MLVVFLVFDIAIRNRKKKSPSKKYINFNLLVSFKKLSNKKTYVLVSNFLFSCLVSLHMTADWWESHGVFTPDFQRLAIKILSLTCNSFACERNWSTFEQVN